MPPTETSRHDRYTIELYCQHCGTYLTTQVGIERHRVAEVRAKLRELTQQHAPRTTTDRFLPGGEAGSPADSRTLLN